MYVKFIVYRLYWPILSSCHYCVANYELDFHRLTSKLLCTSLHIFGQVVKPFMYFVILSVFNAFKGDENWAMIGLIH